MRGKRWRKKSCMQKLEGTETQSMKIRITCMRAHLVMWRSFSCVSPSFSLFLFHTISLVFLYYFFSLHLSLSQIPILFSAFLFFSSRKRDAFLRAVNYRFDARRAREIALKIKSAKDVGRKLIYKGKWWCDGVL